MKQLIFFFVFLFAGMIGAFAHTELQHSEPKDGATLKQPPSEIRMWFSEPMKVALSTVQVRSGQGEEVDTGNLHADAQTPSLVHLSLKKNLSPGTYKVSWTAVAEDMHVSKGGFTFMVAP